MSRSKPRTGSKSPVRKYIEYGGGEGIFTYYDKGAKESVAVDLKNVIVLDVRNSITGFSKSDNASISSNLIADINKDELTVVVYAKSGTKTIAKGLYKDIKQTIKDINGKFTTNIIALADVGDGEEIVNIQLAGIGNSSWISFSGENPDFYDFGLNLERGVLSKLNKDNKPVPVTDKEEKELDAKLKKNPRASRPVWFYVVDISKAEQLTDDEIARATEEDEKLQAYFDASMQSSSDYATKTDSTAPYLPTTVEDDEADEKDDLPF